MCNSNLVTVPSTTAACDSAPSSRWLDRTLRNLALRSLQQIRHGQITFRDSLGSLTLGEPGTDGLHCTLHVNSLSLYRTMIASGSLGAAEAFMEGVWTCDDLTALIRILSRNITQLESMDR